MQLHRANLIAVTPVGSVPDDLRPFVEFKAGLLKKELKKDQQVALFLIESTSCYIPIFIDRDKSIQEIKDELAAQDAEMPIQHERVIEERLKGISSEKKK